MMIKSYEMEGMRARSDLIERVRKYIMEHPDKRSRDDIIRHVTRDGYDVSAEMIDAAILLVRMKD